MRRWWWRGWCGGGVGVGVGGGGGNGVGVGVGVGGGEAMRPCGHAAVRPCVVSEAQRTHVPLLLLMELLVDFGGRYKVTEEALDQVERVDTQRLLWGD